jgi:serine/threonine protein kinase
LEYKNTIYQYERELGSGSFGVVLLYSNKVSGEKMAVKIIKPHMQD